MECPRTDILIDQLGGASGPGLIAAAQQHLDSCPECQRQLLAEIALRISFAQRALSSASGCPRVEELLAFAEAGDLPERQRDDITALVRECDTCAYSIAQQRAWLRALAGAF